MANKRIEDVEGIGPVIGEKLREVGVKDTDTLLQQSKTPAQRKKLAEVSGISEARILKFANMADLYRINGVGSEYAELLEAAGVDTVVELSRRNAENLTKKMQEVNAEKRLTRRTPPLSEVAKWIEQAGEMPRALEY